MVESLQAVALAGFFNSAVGKFSCKNIAWLIIGLLMPGQIHQVAHSLSRCHKRSALPTVHIGERMELIASMIFQGEVIEQSKRSEN
ncbi:hypothetical protein IMCC3135_26515 [Granulosicoccus antarcticus IMCC3135]|uniref:Uncharacterized protein n=1 Tax=Granulosicoccus antarcticus IMCC3135 TaxID=1192854 RepID=A0A2Z2NZZ6_9GAMM|nr:hypothetical protein IMCC3135_26515 [Granulosicoccus antarcticus IMCC3135]